MALKPALKKSDKGMWFQFSDGHIDGVQKKAALDFVKKKGIIKIEKVKNIIQ